MKQIIFTILLLTWISIGTAQTITTTGSGNWDSNTPDAPWPSGTIPTSGDNVVIAAGHTVTINLSNAECNDITVNGTGILVFRNDGIAAGLTVNGSVDVQSGGVFKALSRSTSVAYTASPTLHTLTIYGNLTNAGTFDMREGGNGTSPSGTDQTVRICNVTFAGASNSTITFSRTSYLSSAEEFNSVTINKSSGAKVILASGNVFMSNNGTVGTCVLTLSNGIIETGNNIWVALSTSAGGVSGGSSARYINGALGRGLSTSAATNRNFEVGSSTGYRRFMLHSTGSLASGSFVAVRMVEGNANNASSFTGGIDAVSGLRYYKIDAYVGSTMAGASVSADILAPSYIDNDGVTNGSTDLRVAYSTNGRSTWNGITQTTTHTTSPSATFTTITPDALGSPVSLSSSVYVAIANATGGLNPLPVELNSFAAEVIGAKVQLRWSTATEQNNAGFDVEKLIGKDWTKIGSVEGHGTTNAPQSYSFIDARAKGRVIYRLKQIDRDGAFTYSRTVEANAGLTASDFTLTQNHPNPFNPSTSFSFAVPASEQVSVTVYNALGQAVRELFNGIAQANELYTLSFDGSGLSSGTYFYTLRSASRNEVRKMSLMK